MKFLAAMFLSLFVLVAPALATFTAVPIPLCQIEGPDVFFTGTNLVSAGATNCQPPHPEDWSRAVCWTRSPDALIPAYLVQCHCFWNGDTNEPGHIPGTYAIASSGPCPAGVATVLTSNVGFRSWGVDGGCDDAGDLGMCPVPTPMNAALDQMGFGPLRFHRQSVAATDCQKCKIRADGTQVCHAARCTPPQN